MKIIHIDLNAKYDDKLKLISDAIQNGETVVFPTDTCYGIAVDPTNRSAMDRLFILKNRPHDKNISCVFKGIDQIALWAKIGEDQKHDLDVNLPGSFTFILDAKIECPLRQLTVGVRIPNFEFTQKLSSTIGIP